MKQQTMTVEEYQAWVRSTWSEAEFLTAVIALARECGWSLIHHQRPARTKQGWRSAIQGTPGFPDAVIGRAPGHAIRLIVAELKIGNKKPTVNQYAWLAAFKDSGVQTFFWTPKDWREIETLLRS